MEGRPHALPLHGPVTADGSALAAISVSMEHRSRVELERLAPVVKRVADAISTDLRTKLIA